MLSSCTRAVVASSPPPIRRSRRTRSPPLPVTCTARHLGHQATGIAAPPPRAYKRPPPRFRSPHRGWHLDMARKSLPALLLPPSPRFVTGRRLLPLFPFVVRPPWPTPTQADALPNPAEPRHVFPAHSPLDSALVRTLLSLAAIAPLFGEEDHPRPVPPQDPTYPTSSAVAHHHALHLSSSQPQPLKSQSPASLPCRAAPPAAARRRDSPPIAHSRPI